MILIGCDGFGKILINKFQFFEDGICSIIPCIKLWITQNESMKILQLTLALYCAILFTACQNPYRRHDNTASHSSTSNIQANTQQDPSSGKDAFRVSSTEYEKFFVLKYGLLHQKHSDIPFTGKIVQVSTGPNGDYVSSENNWMNGKKNGTSTKWFSNGAKMYERNYKDGKWHGAVTRWWPNGQRMYVTAYTDGKRTSQEAKWQSNGSPIKTTTSEIKTKFTSGGNTENPQSLDDISTSNIESNEVENTQIPSSEPGDGSFSDQSLQNVELPAPTEDPISDNSELPLMPSSLDVSSPSDENLEVDPNSLPTITGTQTAPVPLPDSSGLPSLPDLSTNEAEEVGQPALPSIQETPSEPIMDDTNELPSLPNLPTEEPESGSLPELPGLPSPTENSEDLPLMPEETDSLPALPPLPESGDDLSTGDDLPPLPPLP